MGAPKGNNYWQFRGKHGTNFSYTPEDLWNEAVKYFEWISEKTWIKKEAIKSGDMAGTLIDIPTSTPMSVESFCLFADISTQTFRNYESNESSYKDFFEVSTRIRQIIESQQFEGATVGAYNPNIIARKLGLVDKSENSTKNEVTMVWKETKNYNNGANN
jgi:hypothetical protein